MSILAQEQMDTKLYNLGPCEERKRENSERVSRFRGCSFVMYEES